MLDLLTARILSHDGTLVPTFARYRGCNYASCECANIRLKDEFISKTRTRILKLLQEPGSIPIDKEMRCYAKCPKHTLPNNVLPPSIQVCAWKLLPYNPELQIKKDQTSKLFGLEEELKKHNLMLVSLRSNISRIELNLVNNPVYVRCPRMPYDLDAKVGYRRSKYNPNKKEKLFGYQVVISTSIEPETGLEIPIACLTKPGSAHDGNYFIHLKEQIKWLHPYFKTYIDIADCGFDETQNYNYTRAEGSIPIFDYNIRSEDITQQALHKRDYNQDGWPYAPCKAICRPNGYDKQHKRLSFVCNRECKKPSSVVPQPIPECPHLNNSLGFATHKAIQETLLPCHEVAGHQRTFLSKFLAHITNYTPLTYTGKLYDFILSYAARKSQTLL